MPDMEIIVAGGWIDAVGFEAELLGFELEFGFKVDAVERVRVAA